MPSARPDDSVDALLTAHGLRRTRGARRVLGWLLAHPDTSYTHAQLQVALAEEQLGMSDPPAPLDRVTLYRLMDRLTQGGLLQCRVDTHRVRHYRAMAASVQAMPHFECQACRRDRPLTANRDFERAAQSALDSLRELGYRGMSLDLAVRGVCADCVTGRADERAGRGVLA